MDNNWQQMETKTLSHLFEELIENETKFNNKKIALNTVRTRVETYEQQLSQLNNQLNDIKRHIELKQIQVVDITTQVTLMNTQNDLLQQHIHTFISKIDQLKRQMEKLRTDRKQRIHNLLNKSLNFCRQFGPNGHKRQELIECQQRVLQMITIKNELKTKVDSL
ncbi:uncharacterized protein LOC128965922 [Oppia nitens]|uniref:uncharacterized protein LOC128959196 n=1 Tax=Oppia nitens TaxID=1686743 RepID=UPI0023D9AB91|nr:uncharacterized protein LOC128959196 [Oppia nitens]XP_054168673.1 uncharacterized protein LOC128965922 [Oppia nitens]